MPIELNGDQIKKMFCFEVRDQELGLATPSSSCLPANTTNVFLQSELFIQLKELDFRFAELPYKLDR